MNHEESRGEEIDQQDKEKNNSADGEKREGKGSGLKNKQKKLKLKSEEVLMKDGDQPKKSEYKLHKERNIAQNQLLLASIKGPDFQVAMEEIGKGAPVKKKNKAGKPKLNPEEHCTSAHLSSADRKWVFRVLN